MSDTAIPSAKQPAGKFWAVFVASKIATGVTLLLKNKYNYDLDPAAAVELSGDVLALITWLTTANLVSVVKGWIMDWKDIVKTWRSPVLILFALFSLSACSTLNSIFPDYPKQVAVLEVAMATAEHTALIYTNLPVCGKTAATLCRTPAITAKVGSYDMAAWTAIQAARTAEDQTSFAAAQTAVDAFKSITNGLNVGVPQ